MRPQAKKDAKYEAPRLETYGKLQSLTKGSGGSKVDSDTSMRT